MQNQATSTQPGGARSPRDEKAGRALGGRWASRSLAGFPRTGYPPALPSGSPTNERPDLCRRCGGECCLGRPGIEAPERFLSAGDPAEALAAALASGDWVLLEHRGVPWVDGVPPPPEDRYRIIRYPRPATVDERASGLIARGGERSACVFLAPGGCRLPFARRPRMCQALEPGVDDCVDGWDQRDAALAWLPWQALVADAERRAALAGPAGRWR